MIVALSRIVVTLAARSLGHRRSGWASAMAAELDEAIDDGRPLSFAFGCLFAAWRTLPGHREGRAALGAHALVVLLMLPATGVFLWSACLGLPDLGLGHAGFRGFVAFSSEHVPLLNAGNWCVAPSLTLLVVAFAAGQVALAWFLLDGDWARAHAVGRFNAAALVSLAIVAALAALDIALMLLPAAVFITETLAVLALEHDSAADEGALVEPPDG